MKRIQLLIIEDDTCLQTVLSKSVRSIDPDLEVRWANSAELALQNLRMQHFDIVISDYYLRDRLTTGLWIWDRYHRTFPQTQFLLMSGIATEEFVQLTEGRKKSPRFLHKPFGIGEFRESVVEMISVIRERQKSTGDLQGIL